MICPHCKQAVPDGPECQACGVVIVKVLARRQAVGGQATGQPPPEPAPRPSPPPARATPPAAGAGPSRVRASDRRLANLYGQLGRMLEAGLAPAEVLRLAARHTRGSLAEALDLMRRGIEAGQSFSEAAARVPGLFGESDLVLLQAGEVTGGIPAALNAMAAAAELRLDVRRQVVRACIYPFVLFTLVFFIPKAHLLFTVGWGGYLAACLGPYLATLAALVGIVWVLPRLVALGLGTDRTRRLVRSLPILKGLFRLSAQARFTRHLASGLEAGLPVFDSLRLAARATGHPNWIERMAGAERVVAAGGTLHEGIASSGLLDDDSMLAIAAGERAGRLSEALEQQARLLSSTFLHRLGVAIQILAVVILLATYFYVAQSIIGEYESIIGGAKGQLDQLMKEIGGGQGAGLDQLLKDVGHPTGYSKLPPELKELMP